MLYEVITISVPVGKVTMGRLFDVLGNPLEVGLPHPRTGEIMPEVQATDYHPIHKPAPSFEDQQSISEVFEIV